MRHIYTQMTLYIPCFHSQAKVLYLNCKKGLQKLHAMGAYTTIFPVVSKIFCSSSHAVLMVRRRPPTVNGGGFVVTDQNQRAVFGVDGCGIIGASGQLIVRDGDGNAILFIHKKEGVVQALSVNNWWRGYLTDYGEPSKLVFSLQDPKPVLCVKGDIQVTVEPKGRKRHWDYEVTGSFVQRSCAIKNRAGHVAAQIGVKGMLTGRDFYQVVVQPGYDQAFVVGVIAILDNIHGESTRC